MNEPSNSTLPIVFFDGFCGLCDRFVVWLIKRDPQARLRFSPLQGETAKIKLSPEQRENPKSLVLLKDRDIFVRSDAVLEVLAEIEAPWPLVSHLLRLIPRFIRDLGYEWLARNRFRIFGKRDTCRIPSTEDHARFLG